MFGKIYKQTVDKRTLKAYSQLKAGKHMKDGAHKYG
jgi:hypothetical protein